MPFIEKWRREIIEKFGLDGLAVIQPGDRCYVHYKNMVDRWHEKPSWTTAHAIFKEWALHTEHETNPDELIASRLAWEVFFQIHVMPYEIKKRSENGDIL